MSKKQTDLVKVVKIVFAEFGLPKKIVLDAGTNFTSEPFRQFWREINIEQAITLSSHHQRNGQVESMS